MIPRAGRGHHCLLTHIHAPAPVDEHDRPGQRKRSALSGHQGRDDERDAKAQQGGPGATKATSPGRHPRGPGGRRRTRCPCRRSVRTTACPGVPSSSPPRTGPTGGTSREETGAQAPPRGSPHHPPPHRGRLARQRGRRLRTASERRCGRQEDGGLGRSPAAAATSWAVRGRRRRDPKAPERS